MALVPEQNQNIDLTGTTEEMKNHQNVGRQSKEVMKSREFEYHFRNESENKSAKRKLNKYISSKCACSQECLQSAIRDKLPIIDVLRTYMFKQFILGDIVSGISVGVVQVPQGLSFALLAGLPPIYGLYTSFFPTIFYVLFSTSRHVSVGATSLTSIMVNALVIKIQEMVSAKHIVTYEHDSLNVTGSVGIVDGATGDVYPETIQIVIGVTLLIGLMQVVMSLCHLDFVTTYLSDALIAGFVSAVSFHVQFSQLKYLLGINVKSKGGPLSLVYLLIEIGRNLPKTNMAALITSAICLLVLFAVRILVNEKFKDKMKLPVPIDLIVVILATLISHFAKLKENFNLQIVENIPNGVPKPVIPDLVSALNYLPDIFSVGLIAFSGTFIMTRLFSQRNNYTVRPNQELLALGLSHVFSSFFSCFCFTTVPARCFLHESAGGKTQVSHVIAAVLVLLFMMFLSFLLQALPLCVLASLVCFACSPMFGYIRFAKQYWLTDRYDFMAFMVTFVVTLFGQIDYGLLAGMAFCLLSVVFRTQNVKSYVKGRIENTDFYVNKKKYQHIEDVPGMVVLYFEAPLYFATATMIKERLYKLVDVKSTVPASRSSKNILLETVVHLQPIPRENSNGKESHSKEHVDRVQTVTPQQLEELQVPLNVTLDTSSHEKAAGIHTVIIDCSAILYVDTAGLEVLLSAYKYFKNMGVTFCLASMTDGVKSKLKNVDKYYILWKECAYISVHDAVTASRQALLVNQTQSVV